MKAGKGEVKGHWVVIKHAAVVSHHWKKEKAEAAAVKTGGHVAFSCAK